MTYICGGKQFLTLKGAIDYANKVFYNTGTVLGIQGVVEVK